MCWIRRAVSDLIRTLFPVPYQHGRAMIVDCRDRVQKLVKDGKSEDDAVAAKPLDDIGAKLGVNEQANANFVRLIYRSVG